MGGCQGGCGLAAWLQTGSKEVLERVPEGFQLPHRQPWLHFLLCYMMMCGLQIWMLMQEQRVLLNRQRRDSAFSSSLGTVMPLESQVQDDCDLLKDTE